MSTQIQQVIERTKVLQTVLAEAPESWNPRTAPGKMVQRRNAEEEIKTLNETYRQLLTEAMVKVYVTGSNQAKLTDLKLLAQEFPGAVVVDADALYKRIATPAIPIYNQSKRLNLDVTLVIENDIMVAAQENKVTPTDFPRIPAQYLESAFEKPEESILKLVRETVEKVFGTELQQAMLSKLVVAEAVRLEVTDAPVFVFIVSARDNEIADFERRSFFGGRPHVTINSDTTKNVEGSLRSATSKFMKAKPVDPGIPAAAPTTTDDKQ